jgi:hypothetical protein
VPSVKRCSCSAGWAPATDDSRGVVTRLPSWSMALVFCSLRIGEISIVGVCSGRPMLRPSTLARACGGPMRHPVKRLKVSLAAGEAVEMSVSGTKSGLM